MKRELPLASLNSNQYRLKQPIAAAVEDVGNNLFIASSEAVPGLQGEGPNIGMAMADLADAIVGAVMTGHSEAIAIVEEVPEPAEQPAQRVITDPAPPPKLLLPEGKVFVLLRRNLDSNGVTVEGVTSQREWADRFKRWTSDGTYIEMELDKL
jgi:hypothetical protein